jgi:general stress protein 26
MERTEERSRLVDTLRRFETLMVATRSPNGTMHSRPMAVAEVDERGEIWFVSAKETEKVEEVGADPAAVVTGQDAERYVSVSGELDVIHDPARIAALWRTSFNIWFPEGKDDPNAVLLRLRPMVGEYWQHGALTGVRYLFEATRALLDGTAPNDDALDHAKVSMAV